LFRVCFFDSPIQIPIFENTNPRRGKAEGGPFRKKPGFEEKTRLGCGNMIFT
jgi:hypothetical protein